MFIDVFFPSISKQGILDESKFKAFAVNNPNMDQRTGDIFDRVENKMGKGENAGN